MSATPNLFDRLEPQDPDALLAIIARHAADPRNDKIDLGIGVYRDHEGRTPVFAAIKQAERRLVTEQSTKAYLGAEGDRVFTDRLAAVVLGQPLADSTCLTGIQTPGGSGALRLAAELLARANPGHRIWIGNPTWPNHGPIMREAGLCVKTFDYFNARQRIADIPAMLTTLKEAEPGEAVLIQGRCHNPTGADPNDSEWQQIADAIAERRLVPVLDLAYQGLAFNLDDDAAPVRRLVAAVPEAIIVYSCNKNFGLYRDRVGALWLKAADEGACLLSRQNLASLARSLWSMPPDHGAACVRMILEDAELTESWTAELAQATNRIRTLRARLGDAHPSLAVLRDQNGLFAMLPISPDVVAELEGRHAIYMARSGRINITGLDDRSMDRFVEALLPHLR